jgi:uncharacterized Fe-S cluster protein YjdI
MSDERGEELHEYPSGTLTVEWRPARCQHSGVCVRSLPAVFDTRRRPWVDVTGADDAAIAQTVRRCPSGALRLKE